MHKVHLSLVFSCCMRTSERERMNRTKGIRVSSAWSLDPSLYTESESPQVGVRIRLRIRVRVESRHRLEPSLWSQSCPWAGWVGLGRDCSVFGELGWVNYSKVLKI